MRPVAITVSELNKYIKNKVDEDEYLNAVYVKGEISNFKHHYTGHMYFTLKDDKSFYFIVALALIIPIIIGITYVFATIYI